jgi:hypothetical protein
MLVLIQQLPQSPRVVTCNMTVIVILSSIHNSLDLLSRDLVFAVIGV